MRYAIACRWDAAARRGRSIPASGRYQRLQDDTSVCRAEDRETLVCSVCRAEDRETDRRLVRGQGDGSPRRRWTSQSDFAGRKAGRQRLHDVCRSTSSAADRRRRWTSQDGFAGRRRKSSNIVDGFAGRRWCSVAASQGKAAQGRASQGSANPRSPL